MVLSAHICPETISNPFGTRQGMNFKNVHVCAVDTFPQATLKSPFVFSACFFPLIGSSIDVLQLNHQNAHYDACRKAALCFGLNCVYGLHVIFYIGCFSPQNDCFKKTEDTMTVARGWHTWGLGQNKTPCCTAWGRVGNIAGLPPQVSKLQ